MLCPPKQGHLLAFGTVRHIQAMYFPAFFSTLRTKHYGKNHHPAAKLSGIAVADVKWSAPSEGVGVTVEIRRGCKLAPFVRETGERKACVVAILQTVTNSSVSTEHQKMVPQRLIVIFVHNVPHLVSFQHTNRQSVVLKNRNHLADMADVFVCGVLKPRDCPALLAKLPRRWC